MVLDDEVGKPIEEMAALGLDNPVDAFNVLADGKNRLPSSDRVRTDDGVNGLKHLANVFRRAALRAIDAKAVLLGGLIELWLGVLGRQCIKEML